LSNATFIIPLPVKDNSPKLATEIYTKPDFGAGNVTVALTRSPEGINWGNASPVSGYDPWFLIIKTKAPISDFSPYYVYQFKKDIQIRFDTPDFPVNTLMPIGNETLIVPKFKFNWQNPPMTDKKSAARIEYAPTSFPYSTRIYADYDAPESSSVVIYCSVNGHNGWKEDYDAWVGNYYRDRYSITFNGGSHGWHEVEGKLSVAEGVYPNLDHPEWQKVMNRSV
jgi:hypothetical protein